jgi:diguanylate cyclase (GGDEF)-like protein
MKFYSFVFDEEKIKSLKNIKYEDLLITVFCGLNSKTYILSIVSTIKKYFPDAKIIGTTTDGEIINSNIENSACVLGVMFFDKSRVNTFIKEFKSSDLFEEGKQIAKNVINPKSRVILNFVSGLDVNFEDYVKGFAFINNNVPHIGGVAGDNFKFKRNYVFNEEGVVDRGSVCAVIESDVLSVNIESVFGWSTIGKDLKITEADKNFVKKIDNKSAIDVYKYYFGEEIVDNIKQIGMELPLVKMNSYPVVARAVLDIKNNSLVFGGNFENGDIVRFGIAERSQVLKSAKEAIQRIYSTPVEALMVISCSARKRTFSNLASQELCMLKNLPNAGFFSYGEFVNGNFLNHTFNILSLNEGEGYTDTKILCGRSISITPIQGLIHLVDVAFKEVEKKLYTDEITGFGNKFAFERDLAKSPYGGILFDIKKFSSLNDRYGEKTGDEILKSFSNVLKKLLPESGEIYRIAGDNFFVLFFEEINLIETANKILNYFYSHSLSVYINTEEIKIDIDLIASVVEKEENIKIKADLALHYAKKHNLQFVKYSTDLKIEENIEKELKTISFVKHALKEDRIIPVFQKIQKPNESYEALVRIDDNGTLVSPFYFLDSIKDTRYYDSLTRTMINKVFRKFSKINKNVSINLSFKDIKNKSTVEFLIKMIEKYQMKNKLIIELLETEAIFDFELVKEFVNKMKKLSVKIAIDDFGSGYSNFVYLSQLKPDIIKIDGSLIKDIEKDDNLKKIVSSIVSFAKSLGIETIAEFVKDEKVYNICKSLGVKGFQGYYIHIPSKDI